MLSRDSLTILIVFIAIELAILLLLPLTAPIEANSLIAELNQATLDLQTAPSYNKLISWQELAKKAEVIPEQLDMEASLTYYQQNYQAHPAGLAPLLITSSYTQNEEIVPETVIKKVSYLPVGQRLVLSSAQPGSYSQRFISLAGQAPLALSVDVDQIAQPQIIAEGTQTVAEAEQILTTIVSAENGAEEQVLGASSLTDTRLNYIPMNASEHLNARSFGHFGNCSQNIDLIYNLQTNNYRTNSLIDLSIFDCSTKITFINCQNCAQAPLGKTTRLVHDYKPSLELLQIPGNGSLAPEANAALATLYEAAAAQNIFFYVRSAHRTTAQQEQIYNFRKQSFIKSGMSEEEADKQANMTIAHPYYSEHHLGTAVDLNCSSCHGKSGGAGNWVLFRFLEQNAAQHGFIISYPKHQIAITGYEHEPWHLRFIGVELSTEFAQRSSAENLTLEQFLFEKSLYY